MHLYSLKVLQSKFRHYTLMKTYSGVSCFFSESVSKHDNKHRLIYGMPLYIVVCQAHPALVKVGPVLFCTAFYF